jgi:hypothetical protein
MKNQVGEKEKEKKTKATPATPATIELDALLIRGGDVEMLDHPAPGITPRKER